MQPRHSGVTLDPGFAGFLSLRSKVLGKLAGGKESLGDDEVLYNGGGS
jgi:hypothetical protein